MTCTRTAGLTLGILMTFGASAAEYRSGEALLLQGRFTDVLFGAGEKVRAEFESTDDVFVSGGEVFYSARTSENLFLAGGELTLRNSRSRLGTIAGGNVSVAQAQFRDLILAGGNVHLENAQIQDDVVMAGGKVRVDQGTRMGGSVNIGGGEIFFAGRAGADSVFGGGDVTLAGQFAGNVKVYGDKLRIEPGAVIQGDLMHSAQQVDIAPGARIQGKTVLISPRDGEYWKGGSVFGMVFFGVFVFLGGLLVPVLGAVLFPRLVSEGHGILRSRFWESLGKGLLVLIGAPILSLVLLFSVIGAPVAIASWPFLIVAGILAWVIGVFAVGDQVRRWLKGDPKRIVIWTLLGALAVTVLMWIPVLGFLFSLVLFLGSLGALAVIAHGALATKRKRSVGR